MSNAYAHRQAAHFRIGRPACREPIWMASWLLALSAIFIAIPILDAYDPEGVRPLVAATLWTAAVVSAALAFAGFRSARRLSSLVVSVDDEGVWTSHGARTTTRATWSDIARIRDRGYLGRLDLLDAEGRLLVDVDYRLEGFEHLRALILARIRDADTFTAIQDGYTSPPGGHLITLALIAVVIASGIYVGSTRHVLGYGFAAVTVLVLGFDLANTPLRFRLTRTHLWIDWPMRHRTLRRHEIARVFLEDTFRSGLRIQTVMLQVVGDASPWRLHFNGLPAIELHQRLQAWLREGDT